MFRQSVVLCATNSRARIQNLTCQMSWRQDAPAKYLLLHTRLHGIISQKTVTLTRL